MNSTLINARRAAHRERLNEFFPEYLRPETMRRDLLPNPHAFDQVQEWFKSESSKPWLYAHGLSRRGKTRSLAVPLYHYSGYTIELWSAFDLKQKLASLKKYVQQKSFMSTMKECDILFIDDFGHSLSDSFAENIRLVLESRADERMTVFTSQYSPKDFLKKHNKRDEREQAQALIGRILEFSDFIDFGGVE